MNADLSLDVDAPDQVAAALEPSLRDGGTVTFDLAAGDALDITVAADRLGTLRGGVNTALMLTRTATKFHDHG
ncbi:MAG: hypothetical protein ABEI97_05545 [Candidatus Nanohaloarchaea archaeon]